VFFRRVVTRRAAFILACVAIFLGALACRFSAEAEVHDQPAQAQTQTEPAIPGKYKYDVVSIKLAGAPNNPMRFQFLPDGLVARNLTVMELISFGYLRHNPDPTTDIRDVVGEPPWANSDLFDVEAKTDAPTEEALERFSRQELQDVRQQMLQGLLAERFNLVVHQENREKPVYLLVVTKGGPKFSEAKPSETDAGGDRAGGLKANFMMSTGDHGSQTITSLGAPISKLASWLDTGDGRAVVDSTGLKGKYDFKLQWTPNDQIMSGAADADHSWPSIFTALEQQLGLKLEPGKAPVRVLVIDHVQRPSGN
jgi:uncharacterized protein (TIGR03435 family)